MESDGVFRTGRYSEHDDRVGGGGRGNSGRGNRGRDVRRGGRWTRGRGARGHRGGRVSPRSRFEDEDGDLSMDDVERSSFGGKSRYRPYSSRPSSVPMGEGSSAKSVFNRLGAPAGGAFARHSGLGGERRGESWYKVTIPKGGTQSTDWLIKQLKSSISEPFQAVQVHQLGEKLMFFVSDSRAANQLKQLGQIQSRGGPLTVLVKPSPPPKGDRQDGVGRFDLTPRVGMRGLASRDGDEVMEEDPTEVVRSVLAQRFDTSNRSLNLSDMYHDPAFRDHSIKASMYNKEFVGCILSLIAQYCPELQALDLSNNGLQRLEAYSELPTRCKSLQVLNLSNNQLRNTSELECIGGMTSLSTLTLENNPLSHQISHDVMGFASSLRKLFPNLQTLDGQKLPSPVKFDVPVISGRLPAVAKSYIVNDDVKQLVVTFIEQYYMMFDSDSRDKLLEAYANEAVLSICVCTSRGPRFDDYITHSRNMHVVKDPAKRRSSLKQGRIDIVHFLRGLPRTTHHSKTFSVDVIRATPVGTAFVVYGVYSEVDGSKAVRAFNRAFVLAAAGNGVAIVNDQWTIRNANQKSVQLVHEVTRGQLSAAGPSGLQTLPDQPSLAFSVGMTQPHTTQDEAVTMFSQHTKMNLEWSKKCLTDNNWDYDKATVVFSLMQNQGSIPPEAFQ